MSEADPLVGKIVGRCAIETRLGAGGMGAVYRGMHEALRIPVAVKFLGSGGPGTVVDGASAARFMREAQLAATLRHPNIVRIYDVHQESGLYFIIMELLEGQMLTSMMQRQGQLPLETVRHVGHQVAQALSHAHGKGIVHRDVKPDNIMITADGNAVLMDFGIAAAERSDQKLTQQGAVVGTPWYLAPEQARGAANVDARADIYALGVVLYEMLAGRLPFDGDEPIAQLVARLSQDPIPIQTLRGNLPAEIVTLLGRMLAREPAQRIASAEEVAAALGTSQSDRTMALPLPMAATQQLDAVTTRASELTSMAETAGLPFATPPGAHLLELRLADIRATLKLAEDEGADGASTFTVHRPGEADIVGFAGKRVAVSVRVSRGVATPVSLNDVLGGAMRRGDGALVVRKIEPSVLTALKCWLEGQRVVGPLPAEIVRPLGLFARIRRTKSSGVLAVTDRGQTSLVVLTDGKVTGLLAAPQHRQEIATESEGGIGVWMESCTPDAMLTFSLAVGAASEPRVSVLPDDSLRAALSASIDGATVLFTDAGKEFGLGSVQVFSKYLREATSGIRDVVPVSALKGEKGPADLAAVWNSISSGATAGRDMVVRTVAEAILTGAVRAATEVIPAKKLGKSKQTALAAVFKAKPALDALELSPVVQKLLA